MIKQELKELLNLEKNRFFAVTGGGGKTSLIFYLAKELAQEGRTVLITTTTHMAYDPSYPLIQETDLQNVKKVLEKEKICIAALREESSGKISSLPAKQLEKLMEVADVVLIEADGSRNLPLKVPAQWEPVIPGKVQMILGVMGLDSLGQPIEQCCHRIPLVTEFLKKKKEEKIEEEDLVKIACSHVGLQKGREKREFAVILNKMDVLKTPEPGRRILQSLKEKGVRAAMLSLKELREES